MKEFKTTADLITDPLFISNVGIELDELIRKRKLRTPAKEGYRYQRDWYDRMRESKQLKPEFFVENFASIYNRTSKLSSEYRRIIFFICEKAMIKTLKSYNHSLEILNTPNP